ETIVRCSMVYSSVAPVTRACVLLDRGRTSTAIYTLTLHDALPISEWLRQRSPAPRGAPRAAGIFGGDRVCRAAVHTEYARGSRRSEEHTSELQSRENLVCRLLLEKKKKSPTQHTRTAYWR